MTYVWAGRWLDFTTRRDGRGVARTCRLWRPCGGAVEAGPAELLAALLAQFRAMARRHQPFDVTVKDAAGAPVTFPDTFIARWYFAPEAWRHSPPPAEG